MSDSVHLSINLPENSISEEELALCEGHLAEIIKEVLLLPNDEEEE